MVWSGGAVVAECARGVVACVCVFFYLAENQ